MPSKEVLCALAKDRGVSLSDSCDNFCDTMRPNWANTIADIVTNSEKELTAAEVIAVAFRMKRDIPSQHFEVQKYLEFWVKQGQLIKSSRATYSANPLAPLHGVMDVPKVPSSFEGDLLKKLRRLQALVDRAFECYFEEMLAVSTYNIDFAAGDPVLDDDTQEDILGTISPELSAAVEAFTLRRIIPLGSLEEMIHNIVLFTVWNHAEGDEAKRAALLETAIRILNNERRH